MKRILPILLLVLFALGSGFYARRVRAQTVTTCDAVCTALTGVGYTPAVAQTLANALEAGAAASSVQAAVLAAIQNQQTVDEQKELADVASLQAQITALGTPVPGPQGIPGAAATVTVGTTMTGASGTPAIVTNSGTMAAAVLNFTVPAGVQGPQGPIGQTGPQGTQGPPGVCPSACLSAAGPVPVQTMAVAGQSLPFTPKAVGDTLLVGTDSKLSSWTCSDGVNTYQQINLNINAISQNLQVFLAVGISGQTVTISCPGAAEIYVTETTPTHGLDVAMSISGGASPAAGSLTTVSPNDLVWAYVVTGTAANSPGWSLLSNLNGNLVAWKSVVTPGVVSATFPTTAQWGMDIVALKP